LKQFQNLERKKYYTVETVPKSREKKNTTLLKQFKNLEKKKYHTVETVQKI